MKKQIIILTFALLGIGFRVKSQSLPVIAASSAMVDIREGKDFYEQYWKITPEYKPDVYETNKIGEKVTFYTDIDSISFTIHPDSVYNFIIVLNKKDSAYTQIKYAPTYLDILQKAGEYNDQDHTGFPEFFYQDSSTAALRTLRQALKLDSIAGSGNELSRILNLVHWIHDLIPHDGNHENPVVKNAMSMIKQCKQEARGLNCRGMATVLNECYLALGIKSRLITCMPKDSVFNDCHVINMVFSEQLDKWIWIDPTHDAYIMDEQGTMLGLAEARERLINGGAIILNPDANWNNRSSTVKEYYLLEYMAKNLYRFSCPLRSEYDYETNEKGKIREYVELIPLDGLNQTPKVSKKYFEKSGLTVITYKTNNPNQFWVKPNGK